MSMKPRVVVHLGNVGIFHFGEKPAEKTEKYAARFKGIHFIGIDAQPMTPPAHLPNWRQVHADFLTGLDSLAPHSVDIITSDLGVGFYSRAGDPLTLLHPLEMHRRYTEQVLGRAFEKLRPGGKLLATVYPPATDMLRDALASTPFINVRIEGVPHSKRTWTYWIRRQGGRQLVSISARKPK